MKIIAETYREDVAEYASMNLLDFYTMVKDIPYKYDMVCGKLGEILQRPQYTLNRNGAGGDCDDKAIVMASYAILNKIPYRFKAVGKIPNGAVSHVYTEFQIEGEWIPVDATYPHNTLGKVLSSYKRECFLDPENKITDNESKRKSWFWIVAGAATLYYAT
jgi:transglutaminase-like putative cysteine protease